MVNNRDRHLDYIFHALSDPTRRAMLARLVQGQCNVSELPNPHRVSKAAISKHLTILHRANLVDKHKSGRETHCFANLDSLDEVYRLLDDLGRFWRSQLDSLEQYFNANSEIESKDERQKRGIPKGSIKKSNSR